MKFWAFGFCHQQDGKRQYTAGFCNLLLRAAWFVGWGYRGAQRVGWYLVVLLAGSRTPNYLPAPGVPACRDVESCWLAILAPAAFPSHAPYRRGLQHRSPSSTPQPNSGLASFSSSSTSGFASTMPGCLAWPGLGWLAWPASYSLSLVSFFHSGI